MIELGVNIDHVATVRQARRTYEPDPVWAAVEAHLGGADGICRLLRPQRGQHVGDVLRTQLGELVPADLTNRATTDANHNARNVDDLLSGFRTARIELVRLLTNADDTIVARTAVHPRLERELRLIDHMEFVADHDDHHLAVIGALIR